MTASTRTAFRTLVLHNMTTSRTYPYELDAASIALLGITHSDLPTAWQAANEQPNKASRPRIKKDNQSGKATTDTITASALAMLSTPTPPPLAASSRPDDPETAMLLTAMRGLAPEQHRPFLASIGPDKASKVISAILLEFPSL